MALRGTPAKPAGLHYKAKNSFPSNFFVYLLLSKYAQKCALPSKTSGRTNIKLLKIDHHPGVSVTKGL